LILSEAQKIVADVLGPYPMTEFFDQVFGRKPLALLNQPETRRELMLGDAPKTAILNSYAKYAASLTCHIDKPVVPPPTPHAVPDAAAFAELIAKYHQTGYTVRIPEVTDISPQLSRFTRALEFIVQNPVGVVIFWSETGARAPVHHDEVDVIVIQLQGSKRWFISDEPPTLSNNWTGLGEQPPALGRHRVIDVSAGDLLYVPRGTAHTVESTGESIHLSIGFVPVTVREAIAAALDFLSDLDKPLRLNLGQLEQPVASSNGAVMPQQIRHGIEKLRNICQSEQFLQDALNFRTAKMIQKLPKLTTNRAVATSANQQVRHHPLAIAQLMATPHILDFRQPGKQSLIHLGVERSVRFIINTSQFSIRDIPGDIGDDVRLALVNKMLADGYLQLLD
jgi:mannose-6-phosphate isomerase-like protein (cupin superfamily)